MREVNKKRERHGLKPVGGGWQMHIGYVPLKYVAAKTPATGYWRCLTRGQGSKRNINSQLPSSFRCLSPLARQSGQLLLVSSRSEDVLG